MAVRFQQLVISTRCNSSRHSVSRVPASLQSPERSPRPYTGRRQAMCGACLCPCSSSGRTDTEPPSSRAGAAAVTALAAMQVAGILRVHAALDCGRDAGVREARRRLAAVVGLCQLHKQAVGCRKLLHTPKQVLGEPAFCYQLRASPTCMLHKCASSPADAPRIDSHLDLPCRCARVMG